LICPEDLTIGCGESTDPELTGMAAATDNCEGSVEITYNDTTAGACPTVITREWMAKDECGNASTCTQLITIEDTTPPAFLSGPENMTIQCPEEVPQPDMSALAASDDCSDVTFEYMGEVSEGETCLHTVTRTYRATDACGNFSEYQQVITVEDTTPPAAVCKSMTLTLSGGSVTIEAADLDNGSSDNCSPVTMTLDRDTFDCSDVGTNEVQFTVTDGCGNSSSCTALVIVQGCRESCITRTIGFWFTHPVNTNEACATLKAAIEANGGKLDLGFVCLPTQDQDGDSMLTAEDTLREALGLFWKKRAKTGDGVRASVLCRARKQLALQLIAATANQALLGTDPGLCISHDEKVVPPTLLEDARKAAACGDLKAIRAITRTLDMFNMMGSRQRLPAGLSSCKADTKTAKLLAVDPTTQALCENLEHCISNGGTGSACNSD
jgi:hypothetical protein